MEFNKAVQRVSIVRLGGAEVPSSTVIYRKSKKKQKKISGPLAFPERLVRRTVGAGHAVAGSYLDRHSRSNRKRRNGWVHDFGLNMTKALGAAPRHLNVRRILPNVRLVP
jgi:hypothetical protein